MHKKRFLRIVPTTGFVPNSVKLKAKRREPFGDEAFRNRKQLKLTVMLERYCINSHSMPCGVKPDGGLRSLTLAYS